MSQNRKYTVFISSTYTDLVEERQEIVKACLKLGHIPIGMEMFNAGNKSQWEVISRTIKECDYYVVVIAECYGSTIESEGGISYTEKEYDEALRLEVPVMGLVIRPSASWPGNKREKDRIKQGRLAKFKDKVQSKMVEFWEDKTSLRTAFVESFMNLVNEAPRDGWVRASEAISPQVTNEIARLSAEADRLRAQLAASRVLNTEDAKLESIASELERIPSRLNPHFPNLRELFVAMASHFDHGFSLEDAAIDIKHKDRSAVSSELHTLSHWDVLEVYLQQDWNGNADDMFQITGLGRQVAKWHARQKHLADADEASFEGNDHDEDDEGLD